MLKYRIIRRYGPFLLFFRTMDIRYSRKDRFWVDPNGRLLAPTISTLRLVLLGSRNRMSLERLGIVRNR